MRVLLTRSSSQRRTAPESVAVLALAGQVTLRHLAHALTPAAWFPPPNGLSSRGMRKRSTGTSTGSDEGTTNLNPEQVLGAFQIPHRSNWFTIGYGQSRVTVRSQQVRALNLAWAIRNDARPKGPFIVIGGGAAGVTVAAGLAHFGEEVTVLEKQDVLLPLQYHCQKRHIHPHVFDWPHDSAENPFADLPLLNWKAGSARDVARTIASAFDEERFRHKGRLKLEFEVKDIEIDSPSPGRLSYRYRRDRRAIDYGTLIFALGFGVETPFWEGPWSSYWADDSLDQYGVFPPRRYLISGTGDGGIIDLLRLLLKNKSQPDLARMVGPIGSSLRLKARQIEDELDGLREKESPEAKKFLFDAYHDLQSSSLVEALDGDIEQCLNEDVHVTLLARQSTPFSSSSRPLHRLLLSRLYFGFAHVLDVRTDFELTPEMLERDGHGVILHLDGWSQRFDRAIIRHGAGPRPLAAFPKVVRALGDYKPITIADEPQYDTDDFATSGRRGAVIHWSSGPDEDDYLDALSRKVRATIKPDGSEIGTSEVEKLFCEMREIRQEEVEEHEAEAEAVLQRGEDPKAHRGPHEHDPHGPLMKQDRQLAQRLLTRIPSPAVQMGSPPSRVTILTGAMGCGKTTFTQAAAHRVLREHRSPSKGPFPVWIDGRVEVPLDLPLDAANEEEDYAGFLADLSVRSLELANFSRAATVVRHMIRHRRVSIFLDSIDAWPAQLIHDLLTWLDAENITTIISTRRIPRGLSRRRRPPGVSMFEIVGISHCSIATFVLQNTEHAPTTSWANQIAETHEWARNPFLLAMSIHLRIHGFCPSEAPGLLDIYSEQIAVALGKASEGKRHDVREVLTHRAYKDLLSNPPRLLFRQNQLPRDLRHQALRTGLVGGHHVLEFSHLSIGEYLASGQVENLAKERKALLHGSIKLHWQHMLEVLPMAHARSSDELEQAWQMSRDHDPEHRMLTLALRAIVYGGSEVRAFCRSHATFVVREAQRRLCMPSGRFGKPERALMQHLHRAKEHLRGAQIDTASLPQHGEPGAEGWGLAATFGNGLVAPPVESRWWQTAFHQAEALLPLDPQQVWEKTLGGESFDRVRAYMLLSKGDGRDLLCTRDSFMREMGFSRGKHSPIYLGALSDSKDGVREKAIRLQEKEVWSSPHGQDILESIVRKDPAPGVRASALELLDNSRLVDFCIAELRLHTDHRRSVSGGERELVSALLIRLADKEQATSTVANFLRSTRSWFIKEDTWRELCSRSDRWLHLLDEKIRSPEVDYPELYGAKDVDSLRPALRSFIATHKHDHRTNRRFAGLLSVALRSLPVCDQESRQDRLELLRQADEGMDEQLVEDVILSFREDHQASFLLRPFLEESHGGRGVSVTIQAIGHEPAVRHLVWQQLREGEYRVRREAMKVLVQQSEEHDGLWVYFQELPKNGHFDAYIRAGILEALAKRRGARILINFIDDPAMAVRDVAVRGLLGTEIAAEQEVRGRLREQACSDSMLSSRYELWQELCEDAVVREHLINTAREDRWAVRQAYFFLCMRTQDGRRKVRECLETAKNDRQPRRESLVRELIRVAAADSEAHTLLRRFLDDRDPDIQSALLLALKGDDELRGSVHELLREDKDWPQRFLVRRSVLQGYFIGYLHSQEVVRSLLEESRCDDATVASVLPWLRGYKPALNILRKYKEDEDPNVRLAAWSGLVDDAQERSELIQRVVNDASNLGGRTERRGVAEILEGSDHDDAKVALSALIDDPDTEIRRCAYRARRRLRKPIESFYERWERERDEINRQLLVDAHLRHSESRSAPELGHKVVSRDMSEHVRAIVLSSMPRADPGTPLRDKLKDQHPQPDDELLAFLKAPQLLHPSRDAALFDRTIRWITAKLVSTLPALDSTPAPALHVDSPCVILGELVPGEELSAEVVRLRLAMDVSELPRNRDIWPAANVFHAWRVASHLQSDRPRTFLLACADLAFVELDYPMLSPGEIVLGPLYFGFRLREAES
jgi:hypothetical protein